MIRLIGRTVGSPPPLPEGRPRQEPVEAGLGRLAEADSPGMSGIRFEAAPRP